MPRELWNPNDASSGIIFSNGNLTATVSKTGNNLYHNARGKVSHSTGKFYFEATMTGLSPGNNAVGVANSQASLVIGATTWFGVDANSVAVFANSTTFGIWYNGAQAPGPYPGYTITSASIFRVAVDIDNSLIWANVGNQGWNGFGSTNDPATGTGGQSFTISKPLYPGYTGFENDTTDDTVSAVFELSSFTFPPPNGFISWSAADPSIPLGQIVS